MFYTGILVSWEHLICFLITSETKSEGTNVSESKVSKGEEPPFTLARSPANNVGL